MEPIIRKWVTFWMRGFHWRTYHNYITTHENRVGVCKTYVKVDWILLHFLSAISADKLIVQRWVGGAENFINIPNWFLAPFLNTRLVTHFLHTSNAFSTQTTLWYCSLSRFCVILDTIYSQFKNIFLSALCNTEFVSQKKFKFQFNNCN